jgi:hypothetical protein
VREAGEAAMDESRAPVGVEAASFAEVSRVTATGAGRFEADLSPLWTIGGRPNGGYLLAAMARAVTASGGHPHVVAASAHFLRSPQPGIVEIAVEELRAGRSATQTRARLVQRDEVCVEAIITTGDLVTESPPYWDRGLPAAGTVPFDECTRLMFGPSSGMSVAIMELVDVRLEQDSAAFLAGAQRGLGELRGWLALPDGESFDTHSLVYAVDGFPPATFDIEYAGWVPTLELTVYVRALPAPGPVRVLHRAQLIDARRVDEVCYVWDSHGRLVAQGTQLAGVRLG